MFRRSATVDALASVGNHHNDDPTTEKRHLAFVGKLSHVHDRSWYWRSVLQSRQNQDPRVDRFYTLYVFRCIQDNHLGEFGNLLKKLKLILLKARATLEPTEGY